MTVRKVKWGEGNKSELELWLWDRSGRGKGTRRGCHTEGGGTGHEATGARTLGCVSGMETPLPFPEGLRQRFKGLFGALGPPERDAAGGCAERLPIKAGKCGDRCRRGSQVARWEKRFKPKCG